MRYLILADPLSRHVAHFDHLQSLAMVLFNTYTIKLCRDNSDDMRSISLAVGACQHSRQGGIRGGQLPG